ncbi:ES1 protein homolog, mitochondrial [Apis mellifera]|uniref:ES1 protein homolog, mitochondrial n=1 Tax=Apis mellifera TaxID=7460 RepID=A0A7M7SSC1_APIME|nr:ES1 protein homolog, mitochondrial [Apis mellifera]|eukprot:XP_026302115.1 ES1 protein homolog, mitochondrial [Apis mellifera]
MLRRLRFVLTLKNESFMLGRSILSSSFHTSQIINRKFNKQQRKTCQRSAMPVAVILCGCGYLDGTEISEAMSAMIHICLKDMKPHFYAPDVNICETVDHFIKKPDPDSPSRNALVEAARIARSDIKPLCQCQACKHEALVIPGGFGAAKTLSNFAEKGADCTIHPDLEQIIEDFYYEGKPIASICISSVLVARVLKGVKITLGKESPAEEWPFADAIKKAKDMGAKIEQKSVKGMTKCKKYNVFSTPAWMYKPATFAEIYTGIGKLIGTMKKHMN